MLFQVEAQFIAASVERSQRQVRRAELDYPV
jgi:hypothetical protein